MPQVLPEGTGGPCLRAVPGGVFGHVVTSVALAPAITAAIHRRGGASVVRTDPSLPRASESPPAIAGLLSPPGTPEPPRVQGRARPAWRTAGDLLTSGVRELRYG